MKEKVGIAAVCLLILLALAYVFFGRKTAPPEAVTRPVTQMPQTTQPAGEPQQVYSQPASKFPQNAPPVFNPQPVSQDYQNAPQGPAPSPTANQAGQVREQRMMRNQQRLQRRQGR